MEVNTVFISYTYNIILTHKISSLFRQKPMKKLKSSALLHSIS